MVIHFENRKCLILKFDYKSNAASRNHNCSEKTERMGREGYRFEGREAGGKTPKIKCSDLLCISQHIDLDFDALESCNDVTKMHIDKLSSQFMYHHASATLTFRFTKARAMTNISPNKSTCDIGLFLLRILNFFNPAITRSTLHLLLQFSLNYLHMKGELTVF